MRRLSLLVLCVVLTAQDFVYGEAIRQPPSLEAGEKYRLAYVTSWTTTAESSDIEFYNTFVQENADASPLFEWGLEWKAIASTESMSARENTGTDPEADERMPVFLLDGTELVPSYSALWHAGTDFIFKSFDINESGEQFDLGETMLSVWTGTGGDGLPFSFTSNNGGPLGAGGSSTLGLGDFDSGGWFASTPRRSDSEARLYAISEPLTAVPEPCSSFHAFVFLSLLLSVRKMRQIQRRTETALVI